MTRHFYDLGWSGVNIEPVQAYHAALVRDRPRDTNLCIAIGNSRREQTLYSFTATGLSTLVPNIAEQHQGRQVEQTRVPVVPLREILVGLARIDFLKIDVEGAEHEVIESIDFGAARPRVIVVEATLPNTAEPSFATWEPLLLAARYTFTLFDGINRFYVAEEEASLRACLSYPACCLDSFTRHASDVLLADLAARLLEAETRANTLATEKDELQQRLLELQMSKLVPST